MCTQKLTLLDTLSDGKKIQIDCSVNPYLLFLYFEVILTVFLFSRSSPDVGYTSTSRYDKRVTENRVYTNNSSTNGVDTTPIIKVSSVNDSSLGRRDSWDAIAKTRNILSDRSLESLANLTESQLDTELKRRKAEEHSKFILKEQSYKNYNENYSSKKYSDSYGRSSPVYSRMRKEGGAQAVRVQPVPDGVLGQPVEFESKYIQGITHLFVYEC